jgi:hypothetical protein
MSRNISITDDPKKQLETAKLLQRLLAELGFRNAVIGGHAVHLLGGTRMPTVDIDILVQADSPQEIQEVRDALQRANHRFVQCGPEGFKRLYYVYAPFSPSLRGDNLVLRSTGNVLIETLRTGSMGLPKDVSLQFTTEQGEAFHLLSAS